MATTNYWEELSAEANRDRRRSKRLPLAFPIEVCGLDLQEHFFTERTVTSCVSEGGCRFRLKAQVATGAIVAIKLINRDTGVATRSRALLFQVAWTKYEKDSYTVGAQALQKDNLWGMAFPQEVESVLTNV